LGENKTMMVFLVIYCIHGMPVFLLMRNTHKAT
jgi:hypothetical protein